MTGTSGARSGSTSRNSDATATGGWPSALARRRGGEAVAEWDRAAGVERLGGGAEDDAGAIEVVQDLSQAPHRASQPVDAVDEEHVVTAGMCLGHSTLEGGAHQGAAAHLIGELTGQLPALLAADVGAQPFVLSLKRIGLILLVGRDAGVGGDAHGQFDSPPSRSLPIRAVASRGMHHATPSKWASTQARAASKL